MAWIDAEPAADVDATALVPAPVEDVFGFLDDLGNHWIVADRFVEVLDLHREHGRATGGAVRLRGPLGVRRTVVTRVVVVKPPRLLIGTAEVAGGLTRARVSWSLAGHLESTRVRLAASIERATPLDRALLALGGRRWLRRRFAATLEGLAEEFSGRDAGAGSGRGAAPLPGDALREM